MEISNWANFSFSSQNSGKSHQVILDYSEFLLIGKCWAQKNTVTTVTSRVWFSKVQVDCLQESPPKIMEISSINGSRVNPSKTVGSDNGICHRFHVMMKVTSMQVGNFSLWRWCCQSALKELYVFYQVCQYTNLSLNDLWVWELSKCVIYPATDIHFMQIME